MTEQQIFDTRLRIGQRIAQLREEKDLTQRQLAEATGILPTNLSRIEKGTHSVGLDLLARIGDALGCSIDFIPE